MNIKKIIKNNNGAVMLQVLLIGIIVAAIATVILNLSLSRTSAMVRIKHKVSAKHYLEACMAEKQSSWLDEEMDPESGDCTFTDDGRDITVTVTVSDVSEEDYKSVDYSIDKTDL